MAVEVGMTRMIMRTYSELIRFDTFEDRFNYLKLIGYVGESTFGFDRYLNQALYHSREWKKVRDEVIIRDDGCDMGLVDFMIYDKIIIHHMNPITIEDLEFGNDVVFNPEFLICVSTQTHNAIHFGDDKIIPRGPVERYAGDTKLW